MGEGWDAATETSEDLPPLEEIQGVEYVTTYQQAYIMQEGIPEWAATVTYYKGCLAKEVTSTGFRIYNSLTDDNTGNLLSDTSNWKKVMDSDDLYALDSTVVHNTGAENVAGVKTFSSSPIVPDGVNSTDAINKGQLDSVETSLQTQINTKATPANITSAINTMLSSLYPVGSLYIGTQTTCPLTSLISGSTWTLVAANKALWTGAGSNANTTITAGLPNITGYFGLDKTQTDGSLFKLDTATQFNGSNESGGSKDYKVTFDASKKNSIYGNSSTVQPPAYVVNVWRRTA